MTNNEFYLALKKNGINFASGVPCAVFKHLLDDFINDPKMPYIAAVREEDALGIAVGAYFKGKKPMVLMQNSGLANCINCLISLLIPSKIPILILSSWRGCPQKKDEPLYHYIMGRKGIKLMNEIGIKVHIISKNNPEGAIIKAIKEMRKKQIPSIILLKKGLLK